jgi:hypothetical protein
MVYKASIILAEKVFAMLSRCTRASKEGENRDFASSGVTADDLFLSHL